MIIRDDEETKNINLYKSIADALSKEIDIVSLERKFIRETLSNEMDYLMEKYKDNEVAQREIKLFNEIISKMIKTDRKGDEIFNEYGFEAKCRKINKTEG